MLHPFITPELALGRWAELRADIGSRQPARLVRHAAHPTVASSRRKATARSVRRAACARLVRCAWQRGIGWSVRPHI